MSRITTSSDIKEVEIGKGMVHYCEGGECYAIIRAMFCYCQGCLEGFE